MNRVVKHLGSARDEATLRVLLEKRRQELCPDQLEFDLFDTGCPGASRATTLSKCSVLLWGVIRDAYRVLGFGQAIGDGTFEQLVLARIVEPSSKVDTVRILDELGVKAAHRNTFCNAAWEGITVAELLWLVSNMSLKWGGELSLVLYDVTTLYFEVEKEDEDSGANQGLCKVGYSKERRIDPQIVVGLLVDRSGFPLEIGCFQGNKAETKTLLPIVRGFQKHHGLDSFVVVADAGMLSAENL
ncbi:IS1634 family transposase [uncultured Varibaculum sp.]|uniref:IS1634 family transposase n=1 Tax=uncultured Varibaculum sp. TaxID=413896 RepID=UPI0025906DBF|nr:IS1634 family transposase [uncultured Varibaculum sp.]